MPMNAILQTWDSAMSFLTNAFDSKIHVIKNCNLFFVYAYTIKQKKIG